jgi:iron(III) transport system ATP-binding protein
MTGLVLDGVTHAFGGQVVVDGVSVRVDAGELVCLVGPSGCGKTTTLRIAAGLEQVQSGSVVLGGRVVGAPGVHVPPEDRGVGLAFQDYALFPHLRVIDNVAFGLSRDWPAARRLDHARGMLERVGLLHLASAYPHTLSGGEQQRVALARALAPGPALMLLDEPFSGLDTGLRDQVRDAALALLKDLGTATLLVTHDPEEAMRMADRIVLMRDGRIVQEEPPSRVYSAPDGPFCCSFFSRINKLGGIVKNGHVDTPLGRLDAGGLPDDTVVDVLIRPESIRLEDCASSRETSPDGRAADLVVMNVVESRVLGPYSLVYVAREDVGRRYEVRVPGMTPPVPGSRCRVWVDRRQAFVFPAAGRSGIG